MKQLIQIKNKNINSDKIISIDHAINAETNKQWLVVNLDVHSSDITKIFFEITNEHEYTEIVEQIKEQL